jgi:ribosomal protein S18 acetylase RimI-like enzyme
LIRSATVDDIAPWGRLWDASARAAFAPLLPEGHPFPPPNPDRVRERLRTDELSLLVADDGGLVGFTACGTSRDPDVGREVGEIWSLFVAAGRWRRGTGRALMTAALADLAERGYEQATVWSFDANARANAFYERHGFTRDGSERREEVWANILEVRYRRTLP